jgi:dipeptidase E
MPDRTIVAMGGGDPGPVLDYVLGLVRDGPNLLWVGTAGAEDPWTALQIHDRFQGRGEVRRLEFFPWPPENMRELVLSQDVIVVGGGNTANMLAIWRVHGLDHALKRAWEAGVVLAGLSAGSNCWFEASTTDSFGPLAALKDGLGLVAGSHSPHYDGEPGRRPTFHRLIASGELPGGLAADDGAALVFDGTQLAEVVGSRPSARAYRVVRGATGEAIETELPTRYLG